MGRIYGLDVGTTSIGWAVVRCDGQGRPEGLEGLGVRIFPEGRDEKNQPLNQERRAKRMMRRQLRRRRLRRRALAEALHEAGLLPAYGTAQWDQVMRIDDRNGVCPYAYRHRGLTEALESWELGRALYHLAKRRHFKGRDLEDEAADNDAAGALEAESKAKSKAAKAMKTEAVKAAARDADDEKTMKAEAEALHRQLQEGNTTLGSLLHQRNQVYRGKRSDDPAPRYNERIRGTRALREDVEAEFDRLWAAQSVHHPRLAEDGLRERIREIIFFQRPVFWRLSTLGECRFWPGAELCPKGSWLSAQKRMLEKLNNLALVGGNARPLDEEERAAILAVLQTQASMTWPGVRKALAPLYASRGEKGAEKKLRFNLEDGGEKKLDGNAVEQKLVGVFGAAWVDHPHRQAIRDALHQRLWGADYERIPRERQTPEGDPIRQQRVVILPARTREANRDKAARSFIQDFGITEEQAGKIKTLTLTPGWEPFSTRALEAFLPHLEQGVRFGALLNGPEWEGWREDTFPGRDRPTGEVIDRLPSPAHPDEQARLSKLRNPTVVRVQNELRKVVNNLISAYGPPDTIRIEVTRDVARSARDRAEAHKRMEDNRKKRDQARKNLQEKRLPEPSGRDIDKWLLWKETAEHCPYTGEKIEFEDLFRTGRFEIEHIWPRSESLDDSLANKTLCCSDRNKVKGKRTPHQAFGHDPVLWDAMITRITGWARERAFPDAKVKRFLAASIPRDFANRQLTDTGWAAREAASSLRRLWPDTGMAGEGRVETVRGQMTARMRRLWELNDLLSDDGQKNREDHRHHAVDALVVACLDRRAAQALGTYWAACDNPEAAGGEPFIPKPWLSIRNDAASLLKSLVVSHKVTGRKLSGPLHEETVYGDTGENVTKNGILYRVVISRKAVDGLTDNERKNIRDDRVSKIVSRHIEANGGDPKKAFATWPRVSETGPEIRKVRILKNRQEKLLMRTPTGFVEPGNNHHIALYRNPDGKGNFEVVNLLTARQRLARRESVVRRERDDGARFVLSLCKGEAFEYLEGDYKGIWVVEKISANGQVSLRRHHVAPGQKKSVQKQDDKAGPEKKPGINEVEKVDYAPRIVGLLPLILAGRARKVSIDPIGRVRPARD